MSWFIWLMIAIYHEGFTEAFDELKFNSKYEDKFHCLSNDGRITESEERVLVLSPEDYYFFQHSHLENVNGKYIPKTIEKTFSNVIIVNGILHDKSGGYFVIKFFLKTSK